MTDAQLRLDETKGVAFRSSEELQQLVAEHHELDARIHNLSVSSYLTDQQQFEEVQLKKRKLALKDRIEALLRVGRQPASAAESSA
ncbi:MAG TPA: YdcH family protein [Vicinamibacterales bacterium]|nr:YdcH family protein [Vicinamibacterales bacterium]